MNTTHHTRGRSPRCTASPVGRLTPCSQLERTSDVTPWKHLAAAAALTIGCTTPMSPAAADSRASRGMGRGPGPCMAVATATERALMRNESNGWPTAKNPRSTAFGCAQALLMIRAKYCRRCGSSNAWTTNVAVQMCIMRRYIADRYGTTEAALAARRRKGWY